MQTVRTHDRWSLITHHSSLITHHSSTSACTTYRLQALLISGNPIGLKGCAVLPEMLLQSSLVSLGASDLRMTRDVALRLAQAAKASPHLVSLDIHSNRIGVKMSDTDAKQFCEMVASTKGGAKVLRELNLGENDFDSLFSAAFGSALAENETLEVLNLHGNPICTSDTGLLPREFVLSVTGSESLMHLDLSACGLSPAGVSGFFDAFVNNRSIIELRLVGDHVDDAVSTIAAVLKKDEVYLRVLDLSSTKLGASGVLELAEALESNKQLTTLAMRDCGMTLASIPAMLEHLSKNSTLQTVDLRGNGLPSKLPDTSSSDARCLL
jgi:Ran GTPase-activating protein (RanGAP) involved in mRNA processing and transport